ncbi:hypothetical protein FKB34_07695 [Glycocaulis profundi]|nr:hypothetical protein FKB34_07695 [Glycocaulis profundi]
MKAVLAAAGAALFAAGAAQAQCYAAFAEEGRAPELVEGYSLSETAAAPGPIARPPVPEDAAALLCERETVVPDANDFKILHHGLPLYIQDDDTLVALGFSEGQYTVTVPQGAINDDEREAIFDALRGFNDGEAELARWMEENPDAAPQR